MDTLARGARQLVVQEALETTFMLLSYFSLFTPITNIGASAEGAEMITFLAPPLRWAEAVAVVVNTPVDSTTYSAPALAQGIALGSFSEKTWMARPFTDSFPQDVFVISTSPLPG